MNDKTAIEHIYEQEGHLFRDWHLRTGKAFIEDGVVDKQCFLQQKCRFVFVLKEANDLGKSLVGFLKEGAPGNGGHTWNPVCRWLTGEASRVFSSQQRAEVLRRIAVMNLKKTDRQFDGNYTTHLGTLEKVVEQDRELIKKQLEIYAQYPPVVFVCCGPGLLSMIKDYVFNQSIIQQDSPLPFMKPFADREVYLVAFYHPNAKMSGLAEKFKSIKTFLPIKS